MHLTMRFKTLLMRTTEEETGTIVNRSSVLREYIQDLETLQSDFNDLAELAAKITGMQTCLINLVDVDLQWTIGSYNSPLQKFSFDESICRYTILRDTPFEVEDLSKDVRFTCMKRIKESGLRYYYGIPLHAANGLKIGALCVLDRRKTLLSASQKEVLQLTAGEINKRLQEIRRMNRLRRQLSESERLKWILAHDIRGPLQGINGLSELALEELNENRNAEIPDYFRHIAESSNSLLSLSNAILIPQTDSLTSEPEKDDLNNLRDHILRLFMPALLNKRLAFTFKLAPEAEGLPLPASGFIQAISNLVANAIKFTPDGGQIAVQINVRSVNKTDHLCFIITDTGIGMAETTRQSILSGIATSRPGTAGENGNGLGLIMVRKLVQACNGELKINSHLGLGTSFTIITPL